MNYFAIFNDDGKSIGYHRTIKDSYNDPNGEVKLIDESLGEEIDKQNLEKLKRLRLVDDSVEVFSDDQLWNEILNKRDELLNQYSDKTGTEWDNYKNELQAIEDDGSSPLEFSFPEPPGEE